MPKSIKCRNSEEETEKDFIQIYKELKLSKDNGDWTFGFFINFM